eukprot:g4028.t1
MSFTTNLRRYVNDVYNSVAKSHERNNEAEKAWRHASNITSSSNASTSNNSSHLSYSVTIHSHEVFSRVIFGRIGDDLHVLKISRQSPSLEEENEAKKCSLAMIHPGDKLLLFGDTVTSLLDKGEIVEMGKLAKYPLRLVFGPWWPEWNESYQECIEKLGLLPSLLCCYKSNMSLPKMKNKKTQKPPSLLDTSGDISKNRALLDDRLRDLLVAFSECAAYTLNKNFGKARDEKDAFFSQRGQLFVLVNDYEDAKQCLRDCAALQQWNCHRLSSSLFEEKEDKKNFPGNKKIRELVHSPLFCGIRYLGHQYLVLSVPPSITNDTAVQLSKVFHQNTEFSQIYSLSNSIVREEKHDSLRPMSPLEIPHGALHDNDNNNLNLHSKDKDDLFCLIAAYSLLTEMNIDESRVSKTDKKSNLFLSWPCSDESERKRKDADGRLYILFPFDQSKEIFPLAIPKPNVSLNENVVAILPANEKKLESWKINLRYSNDEMISFVREKNKVDETVKVQKVQVTLGRYENNIFLYFLNSNDETHTINTQASSLLGSTIRGDVILLIDKKIGKEQETKVERLQREAEELLQKETIQFLDTISMLCLSKLKELAATAGTEYPSLSDVTSCIRSYSLPYRWLGRLRMLLWREDEEKDKVYKTFDVENNDFNDTFDWGHKQDQMNDKSEISKSIRRVLLIEMVVRVLRKTIEKTWRLSPKNDCRICVIELLHQIVEKDNNYLWSKLRIYCIAKYGIYALSYYERTENSSLWKVLGGKKGITVLMHRLFEMLGIQCTVTIDSLYENGNSMQLNDLRNPKAVIKKSWIFFYNDGFIVQSLREKWWKRYNHSNNSLINEKLKCNLSEMALECAINAEITAEKRMRRRIHWLGPSHELSVEATAQVVKCMYQHEVALMRKQGYADVATLLSPTDDYFNVNYSNYNWHKNRLDMEYYHSPESRRMHKRMIQLSSQILQIYSNRLGAAHPKTIRSTAYLAMLHEREIDISYSVLKKTKVKKKQNDLLGKSPKLLSDFFVSTSPSAFSTPSSSSFAVSNEPEWNRKEAEQLYTLALSGLRDYLSRRQKSLGLHSGVAAACTLLGLFQLSCLERKLQSNGEKRKNKDKELYGRIEKLFTEAVQIHEQTLPQFSARRSAPLLGIARLQSLQGKYKIAQEFYLQALQHIRHGVSSFEGLNIQQGIYKAEILYELGYMQWKGNGNRTSTSKTIEEATLAWQTIEVECSLLNIIGLYFGPSIARKRALSLEFLAKFHASGKGKTSARKALKKWSQSLSVYRTVQNKFDCTKEICEILFAMGKMQQRLHQDDEAVELFMEALRIKENKFETLMRKKNQLEVLMDEKEQVSEKEEKIADRDGSNIVLAKLQDDIIACHMEIGDCYMTKDFSSDALEAFQSAMKLLLRFEMISFEKDNDNNKNVAIISQIKERSEDSHLNTRLLMNNNKKLAKKKTSLSVGGSIIVQCAKKISQLYHLMEKPKLGINVLKNVLQKTKDRAKQCQMFREYFKNNHNLLKTNNLENLKNFEKLKRISRVMINDSIALNRALAQLCSQIQPCTDQLLQLGIHYAENVLQTLQSLYSKKIAKSDKKQNRVHPLLFKVTELLAILYLRRGSTDLACKTYDTLINWRNEALVTIDEGLNKSQYEISVVKKCLATRKLGYALLKQPKKIKISIKAFEKAHELCREVLEDDHSVSIACQLGEVEALFRLAECEFRRFKKKEDFENEKKKFKIYFQNCSKKLDHLIQKQQNKSFLGEKASSSYLTARLKRCKSEQMMFDVKMRRWQRNIDKIPTGQKGWAKQAERFSMEIEKENQILSEASELLIKSLYLFITKDKNIDGDNDEKKKKQVLYDLSLYGNVINLDKVNPELTQIKICIAQTHNLLQKRSATVQMCSEILREKQLWHGMNHSSVIEGMVQLALAKLAKSRSCDAAANISQNRNSYYESNKLQRSALHLLQKALQMQWGKSGTEHPLSKRIAKLYAQAEGKVSGEGNGETNGEMKFSETSEKLNFESDNADVLSLSNEQNIVMEPIQKAPPSSPLLGPVDFWAESDDNDDDDEENRNSSSESRSRATSLSAGNSGGLGVSSEDLSLALQRAKSVSPKHNKYQESKTLPKGGKYLSRSIGTKTTTHVRGTYPSKIVRGQSPRKSLPSMKSERSSKNIENGVSQILSSALDNIHDHGKETKEESKDDIDAELQALFDDVLG